jgi:hypothetical protein
MERPIGRDTAVLRVEGERFGGHADQALASIVMQVERQADLLTGRTADGRDYLAISEIRHGFIWPRSRLVEDSEEAPVVVLV